jgi:ABC-type multidrug transport system fused ATPase/permease subunit
MINPIAELVTAATNLGSALSCLDRIQEFLEKPSVDIDGRLTSLDCGESLGEKIAPASSPLFRLTDAVLGYTDQKPVLSNINKTIMLSTFTIITGPVGTGKSTFLRALLGEVDVLRGSIQSSKVRQMAFCDQEPWILNTSVRENILGISEYDADKYRKVVESCQLQYDFDQWDKGDGTYAGSHGISLSGGQKARIVSASLYLPPAEPLAYCA